MSDERRKLELSPAQIIGGALAAASAAVASSWLGLAGTVIGAVIVSLVASIGGALYTHSLRRSTTVIRQTLPVVPMRSLRSGRADLSGATAVLPAVSPRPQPEPLPAASKLPARVGIAWRAVAVSAVASLVLAAVALTGFELVVGKSASSLAGGGGGSTPTIVEIVKGGGTNSSTDPAPGSDGGSDSPTGSTTPAPTSTTSPTPASPTPTSPAPLPTPTPAPTPTPSPTSPTPTS